MAALPIVLGLLDKYGEIGDIKEVILCFKDIRNREIPIGLQDIHLCHSSSRASH